MDNFDYIGTNLEQEINEGLEGEVCAIAKDKNTSAMVLLEKIEDLVKDMVKFRLHILFWDFNSLLGGEGQNGKSSKLTYPVIFKNSNGSPITLTNGAKFRNVEMTFNSSSDILAINLGENAFCGIFDSKFLSDELKKKKGSGIMKRKSVYILMTLVGNILEDKRIFNVKFHPDIDFVLIFMDTKRDLLMIYDIKYNMRVPLYQIDISKKNLKSENSLVDYCFMMNGQLRDFSRFSIALISDVGSLYMISTVVLPYSFFNQSFVDTLKERVNYLEGKSDSIYAKDFRKFLNSFERLLNLDPLNGRFYLDRPGAVILKDTIPSPKIFGPLKITDDSNFKGKFSFFKKVEYTGNDFLHSFCMISNLGRVKLVSTFFPIYPIGIVKNHIVFNKKTRVMPKFLKIAGFRIFDEEAEEQLRKKEAGLKGGISIQTMCLNEKVSLRISSKMLTLNFKWAKRVIQNFIDYKEKRGRDKIFQDEVATHIEENTVTTIFDGENEIKFFYNFTKKMYFLVEFDAEGERYSTRFVNTDFEVPKTEVKRSTKKLLMEGLLAPLKSNPELSRPNIQFQEIINLMKQKMNLEGVISSCSSDPEKVLAEVEKNLDEICELQPVLITRFNEYLQIHSSRISSLSILSLEASNQSLNLEQKISDLDKRITIIKNRNLALKERIINMLKKLDNVTTETQYGSREFLLVEKLEKSLKEIQSHQGLLNSVDDLYSFKKLEKGQSETVSAFFRKLQSENNDRMRQIIEKHNKVVQKLEILKRKSMIALV